ncbi:MAG: hypothetical protein ACLRVD_09195 [Blautia caecimuris]
MTKFCHRAKPYILFWGKTRILGNGYPVYTWDDFLKNSVGFRQTLHGEESCGNA